MVKQKSVKQAVVFSFEVEGRMASISAAKVDPETMEAGEVFEKKSVKNMVNEHGVASSFVIFPQGYMGKAYIVVQGSKPGSKADTGYIET